MKTSTFFALMAEYQTVSIELAKVCEKYFSLSAAEADKRAKNNRLPLPTFRCSTNKSPWMIHLEDLANHIDKQREQAQLSWEKMNN